MALNGQFYIISQNDVLKWWDRLEPMVSRERDTPFSMRRSPDVLSNLLNGESRIVIYLDGKEILFLFELRLLADCMEILIVAANTWFRNGSKKDLIKCTRMMIDFVEKIAVDQSCNKIVANARSGWLGILDKMGYEAKNITYMKKVT